MADQVDTAAMRAQLVDRCPTVSPLTCTVKAAKATIRTLLDEIDRLNSVIRVQRDLLQYVRTNCAKAICREALASIDAVLRAGREEADHA